MDTIKINSLSEAIKTLNALIEHYVHFVAQQTGKDPEQIIKEIIHLLRHQ